MQSVRFNEKVKRLSTLFGAAGIALMLTAVTRWLDRQPDIWTAIWIFFGVSLTLVSVQINDLIEPEEES